MKTYLPSLVLLCLMFFYVGTAKAQWPDLDSVVYTETIQGGSFEGARYQNLIIYPTPPPPKPWIWCNNGSNSPDHQPGNWGVYTKPHHGEHYARLITKVPDFQDYYAENIAAPLEFRSDTSQFMVFYLANNPTQSNGKTSAGGRLQLMIRETTYCPDQPDPFMDTLWVSPIIKSDQWQPQVVNFSSPVEEGFMIFQANMPVDSMKYVYLTNILIDDIRGPYVGSFELPNLGIDQKLCLGDTLWMELEIKSPSVSLVWQDGNSSTHYPITETGEYVATYFIEDARFSDTINLVFEVPLELNLGTDSLVCKQNNFSLGPARNDYEYYWADGHTESPRQVNQSRLYRLTATNEVCTVTDSVFLALQDCQDLLEMPNVFTPNGDGVNDVFQPMSFGNIYSYQLRIFDRWGRVMANIGTVHDGWDGRNLDGGPVPEGVYFYAARYQGVLSEEVKVVKGTVTLMR